MYNWYGTSEENARGNSPANNVSGLLTENYAFRSSERKGGGEEEGEFSISSNRYSTRRLSFPAAKYRINGTIRKERRASFVKVRLEESFFRHACDLASQKNRHELVKWDASELGATTTTITNVVSLNPSCNLLCNTRFRDQSLKGDSNFARIIDGYLGGFPL